MKYLSAKYNADQLTVDYVAGDGTHLLRTGGTAAWRFNNPGNLRPGSGGRILYGAIGLAKTKTNGSFLIFSSYEEGRNQKKLLLRRKYNNRTIYTMLAGIPDGNGNLHEGYAPASDNNDPKNYATEIANHIGKPITIGLSELTDTQLDSMMDAMEKKEGYHGKRDTRKERLVPSTSITISDGSHPKPGISAMVRVGNEETLAKTDAKGRLPLIPHVTKHAPISVFLPDLQGEWQKVYNGVLGEESQVLGLFNTLNIYNAPTAPLHLPRPASKSKRSPISYPVQSGDTLAKIATKFKTSVAEIMRDNAAQIKDASKIYPHQILSIYGTGNLVQSVKRAAPPETPLPAKKSGPVAASGGPAMPARSKDGKGAPLALITPNSRQSPWMRVAVTEAKKWRGKSQSDISKSHNYHSLNGHVWLPSLNGANNAWCASYINYCLRTCSPSYATWKNSFRAKAVALDANFVEISEPIFGAIMLVGTYHVAFVYARDAQAVICLGGNQSDQINFSPFSKNLRFFVPLAYHPFARQEIERGIGLPKHTASELNNAFGIKVKKKKGNATQ